MAAKLRVEPDPGQGRGHALLIVGEPAHQPEPGACLRLTVQKPGGADSHLGPDGWQVPTHRFEVRVAPGPGTGLAVALGPEITRHMTAGNYRFRLESGAGPIVEGALSWRGIAPPLPGDLPTGDRYAGRTGDEDLEAQAEVLATSPIEPIPPMPESATSGDKRSPWLWILLAILLVAGGLGIWAWTAGWLPVPSSMEDVPLQRPTRADLKAYIDTGPDAGAIHERAADYEAEGWADEAFLLYREAANRGSGRSALAIGRLYDPNRPADQPTPFSQPNPVQAREWYRRADSLGADSEPALQGLKDWAEARQDADPDAKQLLETWDQ